MRRGFLVLAAALVAGVMIPAAGIAGPAVKHAGPTVGEFVTMAANAGEAVEPVSTDMALRNLARLGIVVSDPDAPLSQGTLARIMGGLGYQVTTREPSAVADGAMAGAALGMVGSSLLNPLRDLGTDAFTSPLAPGGCLFGGVDCMQCCLRFRIPVDGCLRLCGNIVVSPSGPPT